MTKYLTRYKEFIVQCLGDENCDFKQLLDYHRNKIAFFAHERRRGVGQRCPTPFSSPRFDGGAKLVKGAFEVGALRGDVDADEAVPVLAEDVAAIEPEAGLVLDEALERRTLQAERAAVDPGEVGALGLDEAQLRRAVLQRGGEQLPVAFQVVFQFVQPRPAMLVGGLRRDEPQRVRLAVARQSDLGAERVA